MKPNVRFFFSLKYWKNYGLLSHHAPVFQQIHNAWLSLEIAFCAWFSAVIKCYSIKYGYMIIIKCVKELLTMDIHHTAIKYLPLYCCQLWPQHKTHCHSVANKQLKNEECKHSGEQNKLTQSEAKPSSIYIWGKSKSNTY